ARRVARPLVYEPDGGTTPQIVYPHDMLNGIDGPLPTIKGFVLTTVKENPLVEVSIRSPKPADNANNVILASWTYGVGRAVAFTSDAGVKWADTWTGWDNYDKFWSQLVRWSMRPSGDEGKFTVSTNYKDGKVQVVVTALDKDDEFLNFLDMNAAVIGPDLKAFELEVDQTAPGRYVGEFDATGDGNYFINITAPGDPDTEDPRPTVLQAGVNVPYSAEYRDRESNLALITALARLTPEGGEPGKIIEGEIAAGRIDDLLEIDTFRHNLPKARTSQDVWPLLVLVAACLFFFDVAVRRVQIGLEWAMPAINWIREKVFRTEKVEPVDERLERLRRRKADIAANLEERRAAARFEPQPDEAAPDLDQVVSDVSGGRPAQPQAPRVTPTQAASTEEEDSYTSRLRKAKQEAWKKKE
ncbi:MAG: glutamine amidotransferase, partial [Planctomycetes bacterium]|nr:glutamine amidotransferase [Planctomycetota bacterium]